MSYDALSIARRLLFPSPRPPNYEFDTFPEQLIWVPNTAPLVLPDTAANASTSSANVSVCESIPCLLFPHYCSTTLLVFAHGNGCDLGSMYPILDYYRRHWGCHLLAFEYCGYGVCLGEPSETTINQVMESVYHFITHSLAFPPSRVVLMGQSIGSGPVSMLAARLCEQGVSLGGLVLQSPYTDIRNVVKFLAGSMLGSMAASLVVNRWSNITAISKITCPVLLIHGVKDGIIPFTHSEELYAKCASERKHLLVIQTATHNHFDLDNDVVGPVQQLMRLYLDYDIDSSKLLVNQPSLTNTSTDTDTNSDDDDDSGREEKYPAHSLRSDDDAVIQRALERQKRVSPRTANGQVVDPSARVLGPNGEIIPTRLIISPRYYSVPKDVITAHLLRAEAAKREEENKLRATERKVYLNGLLQRGKSAFNAFVAATVGTAPTAATSSDRTSRGSTEMTSSRTRRASTSLPHSSSAPEQMRLPLAAAVTAHSHGPASDSTAPQSAHLSVETNRNGHCNHATNTHTNTNSDCLQSALPRSRTNSEFEGVSASSPIAQRRSDESPSLYSRQISPSPSTSALSMSQINAMDENDFDSQSQLTKPVND